MLRDITLGQYFPGKSILHKIDPRVKILISIAYIVAVFLAKATSAYILLVAFTAALVIVSGIKVKTVLKGVKPIVFVIIFTAIINVFFTTGETLLFEWKFIHIYLEGLVNAAFMAVRITSLLIGTSVILTYTTSPIALTAVFLSRPSELSATYTTSPIALTDAIERLLSPLRVIKIPVHEFAMMMTIALRFIPTLIEETDKIMSAQKARGADFSTGKLTDRAKALIPVLIPLFISAFRRADELAVAMECRCYRGGKGRTRMTKLHLRYYDLLTALVIAAFIAGLVLLGIYYPIYAI